MNTSISLSSINISSIFLILIFCASLQCLAEESDLTSEKNYPKTCEEAVQRVVSNIDDDSKNLLLSIEKKDLKNRRFITGWGKGIRDGFGLSEGNFELMESCQSLREDAAFHPVNISGIIMEEVWEAVRQ